MAFKSVIDMPQMRHTNQPEHIIKANGGKPLVGKAKYELLAAEVGQDGEIIMMEDFLNGLLKGGSFDSNVKCQAAMQGAVYYGFEIVKNRDITNPSKIMKISIAYQKVQEQGALFYA